MAYYKKQDIIDYVNENNKELKEKGLFPTNSSESILKKLDDEEDWVGYFWLGLDPGADSGEAIKMNGKSWYRINHNLYTDDRFALDLYQAMISGLDVTDVINKRNQEMEEARKVLSDMKPVENIFKKKTIE